MKFNIVISNSLGGVDMNYSEYMGNVIETFPIGMPIFTEKITKKVSDEIGIPVKDLKSTVNQNLKRLADDGVIERIQKGVYYKPKMTAFGKTKPPIELVINETCIMQNDKKIGYVGGETLLHELGLISLIPKNKVIVTNKYRTKLPNDVHIILKKSVTEITDENVRYLQLIDVIAMLDTEYIDAKNPQKIVRQRMDKLNIDKIIMLKIAKKYYPQRVLLAVLDIIVEEDDEITHV